MDRILEIQKRLKLLENRNIKIEEEINSLEKELEAICTHSWYNLIPEFHAGSYFDKAEYWEHKECRTCGKHFDRIFKGYGGYG